MQKKRGSNTNWGEGVGTIRRDGNGEGIKDVVYGRENQMLETGFVRRDSCQLGKTTLRSQARRKTHSPADVTGAATLLSQPQITMTPR